MTKEELQELKEELSKDGLMLKEEGKGYKVLSVDNGVCISVKVSEEGLSSLKDVLEEAIRGYDYWQLEDDNIDYSMGVKDALTVQGAIGELQTRYENYYMKKG